MDSLLLFTLPYPHYIIEVSRELRKRSTLAERVLWSRLRNRGLKGLKFYRQHPFGRYVADFYCAALRLVIELDGEIHESPEQREYDKIRTAELNDRGLTVLRFQNEAVFSNIQGVLREIVDLRNPHPNPSPACGRGGSGSGEGSGD